MSTPTETMQATEAAPAMMSYREAVNAAIDDALADDPAVVFLGEDIANEGGVFKTNSGLPEKHPRARHQHAHLRERLHRRGPGHGRGGHASHRRVHVRRLPAHRRRRHRQPAAQVPLHERRRPLGAGDAARHQWCRRSLRHAAQRHRGVLVHGPARAARGRRRAPRLRPTSSSAPRCARTTRSSSTSTSCSTSTRPRSRAAAFAQVGKASVEREGGDVTIVATMLMVHRALQAASLAG